MRNDHVFYGHTGGRPFDHDGFGHLVDRPLDYDGSSHLGGRPLDYDALEDNLRAARRLRAVVIYDLVREASRRVANAFRRAKGALSRPTRRTQQHC